jgi:hypothetical protein
MVRTWHGTLEKAIRLAVDEGHLRADTDPHQMLFEIHGLILSLHHDARFLKLPGALERAHKAFDRMLSHHLQVAAASRAGVPRAAARGEARKPARSTAARTNANRARR